MKCTMFQDGSSGKESTNREDVVFWHESAKADPNEGEGRATAALIFPEGDPSDIRLEGTPGAGDERELIDIDIVMAGWSPRRILMESMLSIG